MDNNKIIRNTASVELDLCGKKEIVSSNEIEINKIILKIKKESCGCALIDSELEYKVIISNDSDLAVCDLLFKDTIHERTDYVHGSFEVNGEKKTPIISGQTLCYNISEIKECSEILIVFTVRINKGLGKSNPPTIYTVHKNDKTISGSGIPGAVVEVVLNNGAVKTAIVGTTGIWIINLTSPWPKEGDTVRAIQTESGKLSSIEVLSTVDK